MEVIIVTGDTGLLGINIVKTLLKWNKYNIIGIGRRKTKEIQLIEKISTNRFRHINFDLKETNQIKNLFLTNFKNIKIIGLVNNAATAYDDLVTNTSLNKLKIMFDVNVFSPIILTKLTIRNMILHETKGSIVNVGSVSTGTGYKGLSLYASSKGAIEAFSKNVSREWGKVGIRSNCVSPGFMKSNMTSKLTQKQLERIYKRTSLNQQTDPNSVSELIKFLLSDEANSITGQNLFVDSGTF